MSVELLLRIYRPPLVDGAYIDVAVNDRHGSCDQLGGSIGTVRIRRRGLTVAPLVGEEGRYITRVIVVKVGEENGVDRQIAHVAGHQLPYGSVAAIDQIRPAVDHDSAACLPAGEIDSWPGARAEQHQPCA